MSTPAVERMDQARSCVRSALARWNPTDLSGMEATQRLLQDAALELHGLNSFLREQPPVASQPLKSLAASLKQEIAIMLCLVDAGAAFYRGLAVRLGEAAPAYTAGGGFPAELSRESSWLQG